MAATKSSKSSSSSSTSSTKKQSTPKDEELLGKVEPSKDALKEAEEVKDIQIDVHHDNVTNVPAPSASAVLLDPIKGKDPVVLSFEDTGPQDTVIAVDGKAVGRLSGSEAHAAFARKARRVF